MRSSTEELRLLIGQEEKRYGSVELFQLDEKTDDKNSDIFLAVLGADLIFYEIAGLSGSAFFKLRGANKSFKETFEHFEQKESFRWPESCLYDAIDVNNHYFVKILMKMPTYFSPDARSDNIRAICELFEEKINYSRLKTTSKQCINFLSYIENSAHDNLCTYHDGYSEEMSNACCLLFILTGLVDLVLGICYDPIAGNPQGDGHFFALSADAFHAILYSLTPLAFIILLAVFFRIRSECAAGKSCSYRESYQKFYQQEGVDLIVKSLKRNFFLWSKRQSSENKSEFLNLALN